mgnify:CR=1 FL=1
MEVTFTLSNIEFKANATGAERPCTSITADKDKYTFKTDEDVKTVEIKVKAEPVDTDSLISFVSSDKSAALIDELGTAPDENGYVTGIVTILKKENVTITAVADNGVSAKIQIIFEESVTPDDTKPDDTKPGDDNTPTGVVIAFVPAMLAAATTSALYLIKKKNR